MRSMSNLTIPETAEQPTLADRAWWADQNARFDGRDVPEPPGPHRVERRPELVGLAGCYGPWAVFAADGRLRGAWLHEDVARQYARDLDVPAEVWAERWDAYAALPENERPQS